MMIFSTCRIRRICGAKTITRTDIRTENRAPERRPVLTSLRRRSICFAPYIMPMRTPVPRQIPCSNRMISVIRGFEVPTAASAVAPTNRPTTMLSTAL